ncbi:MAG: hypothetical protein H0Z29_04890 [Candidatus Marinimicrobia bacterium]|nr:hypothetical protein [Candidatus Neomarinimicrobiota bacterium]
MAQVSQFSGDGLGILLYNESVRGIGIGKSAISLADSFFIESYNPATWSNFKRVSLCGAMNIKNISDPIGYNTTYFKFMGFSFGFPVSRNVGIVMGIRPEARAKFTSNFKSSVDLGDTIKYSSNVDVDGGLSRFYLGTGYRKSANMHLGFGLGYVIGNYKQVVSTDIEDDGSYDSYLEKYNEIIGRYFNFGAMFEIANTRFLVYTDINIGSRMRKIYHYFYCDIDSTGSYEDINLYSIYGFGLNKKFGKNRLINFELRYTDVSEDIFKKVYFIKKSKSKDSFFLSGGYEKAYRIKAKGKYYNRLSLRTGLFYHKYPNLTANLKNEYGITFGFGYEFNYNSSRIDVSIVYSKRKGYFFKNINENMITINIGVSTGEVWFVKIRK